MQPMLEKFGLTALVTLVATMFITMFAGYMAVGLMAVAAFTAISIAMIVGQYADQFNQEA